MSTLLRQADDKYDRVNDQQTRTVVNTRIGDTETKEQRKTTSRGGLSTYQGHITLANGANNNVSLDYATYIYISGPTGAFSITGIKNGEKGAFIVLRNASTQTLTMAHLSASSSANNRIYSGTGGDTTFPAGYSVLLQYDTVLKNWVIVNNQKFTFSGNITPETDDGAALGTTSLKWSDLFLASGGVINWNNGDVTITHSANFLAFGGADSGYIFTNSADVAANTTLIAKSARANPANNDQNNFVLQLNNSAGTAKNVVTWTALFTNVTSTSETSSLVMSMFSGGTNANRFTWNPTSFQPTSNDGAALGVSGTAWADLFLASGAVINFNAGNLTLTHSAGVLTNSGSFATADLTVTNTPRINVAPSSVGTGTKTISNAADSSTNFGHYLALNLNGTTYYIPCGATAPT